jgi:hypothetical protein
MNAIEQRLSLRKQVKWCQGAPFFVALGVVIYGNCTMS